MNIMALFRRCVKSAHWKKYIDYLNTDKSQTVRLTFLDGTVFIADEFVGGDAESITYRVGGNVFIKFRKDIKMVELVKRSRVRTDEHKGVSGGIDDQGEITLQRVEHKKGIGVISAWYQDRSFGFVVDKSDTYFFNGSLIMDERVLSSLKQGELRQRISYETVLEQPGTGKYPRVRILNMIEDDRSDAARHRSMGHDAMIRGDLAEAERSLLIALRISPSGTDVHLGALKDLAETWNRQDPQKAFDLIEKYRGKYPEEDASFDRMEITYLERLGKVNEVIKKIEVLLAQDDIPAGQRDFYTKKKMRLQNPGYTIRKNDGLGAKKEDNGVVPDTIRHPLIKYLVESCEFHGLENQTIIPIAATDNGRLSIEDIPDDDDDLDGLMKVLDESVATYASRRFGITEKKAYALYVSEEYSREQLRFQLTRVVLSLKKEDWKLFGSCLRSYCFRSAELAMLPEDKKDENLAIYWLILTGRLSPSTHTYYQAVLPKLILGLCAGYDGVTLRRIIEDIEFNKTVGTTAVIEKDAWARFINVVEIFSLKEVFPRLDEFVKLPAGMEYGHKTYSYYDLVDRCKRVYRASNDIFEDVDDFLSQFPHDLELNCGEIEALNIFTRECRQYLTLDAFEGKLEVFKRLTLQRDQFYKRYIENGVSLPCFDFYCPLLDACWRRICDMNNDMLSRPVSIDLLDERSVMAKSEGSRIRIQFIIKRDPLTPRINKLIVSVDDAEHGTTVNEVGTDIYDGELTPSGHAFSVSFEPTTKELEQGAGSVGVRVSYVEYENGYKDSRIIQVKFEIAQFELIVNPYNETGDKAEGNLFVGREAELREIVDVLSHGEGRGGRCFVLYGQRRSGKSSILDKLGESTSASHLDLEKFKYTKLDTSLWNATPGEEDVYSLSWEFAKDISLQLSSEVQCVKPRRGEEVAWIMGVARAIQSKGKDWIIGIDEFTRPYLDWMQEEVPYLDKSRISAFLRMLKGLLDKKLFHLIIIGQECMLQFEDEFPNEFAVTTNRRLSYLSEEETMQLIEEPIRRPGIKSRFSSNDIAKRFLELAGGYPYYSQKICYQIVEMLNKFKSSTIDDLILDRVLQMLCEGGNRLRGRDFDPFVDLLHPNFSRRETAKLYYEIADKTRDCALPINQYCKDGETDPLFKLVLDRDILKKVDEKSVVLRSGLFAVWLRKNWGMI